MACPSPLLPLSFLFVLFHTAFSADPVNHFCFNSKTYSRQSPYKTNLDNLLSLLITKGSPTGFATSQTGQNTNAVYGLVLCRADASEADCKTCITQAGKTLERRCPSNKGAIIWYDTCFLKYTDTKFFGQIDYTNEFVECNLENLDIDFDVFLQRSDDLLLSLTEKARATSKRFATGKVDLGDQNILYGLAECSRDISAVACKECLEKGIPEILMSCYGKRGGRMMSGSCIARYELYPF